eukprot:11761017-Alexandrium_andersonii.AAC.1
MKTLASLGFRAPGGAKGLNSELFDAFVGIAGDPDSDPDADLGERVRTGAPLGVTRPVTGGRSPPG